MLNVSMGYPGHVMSTFGLPTRCAHVWKLRTGLDLHVPNYIDQHCLSPLRIRVSQLYMCIASTGGIR